MKKILPFFSYIFHPIFISVYAGMIYLYLNSSFFTTLEGFFLLLQIALITILIPILCFFLLRTVGKVDSIMMATITQRKLPLIIQCFLIILLVRKTVTIEYYPELHFFFLAGLLSTVLAVVLLFFKIKASLHMMAISSITIFVIGLSIHSQMEQINLIFFLVLMNGFVAASRLEMKAHTNIELVIGFFLGMLPQVLLMQIWL
ncbi:hypothetical protein [Flavobacterium cellulosilyticum]|uniref:Uncharacterized protein n=1 Tax=Flavobacterium cellulosilyticum TaxID=2541731 RepID=A0A4R5CL38_9FLAO|nr:hypothetical protein [Flavobacterium cellulosilyticum]TDD99340.1 hypothetical protein E0F76_01015 [Flavobacterium cellulosilyticum]